MMQHVEAHHSGDGSVLYMRCLFPSSLRRQLIAIDRGRTSENSAPSKTNVFGRPSWLTAAHTPLLQARFSVQLMCHSYDIVQLFRLLPRAAICCCGCIADQWPYKPPFEPKTAPLALHQVVAVSPGGQEVIRLPGYDLDGDELVATITSLPSSGTLHQARCPHCIPHLEASP